MGFMDHTAIFKGSTEYVIDGLDIQAHTYYLDPPFNQDKFYRLHSDKIPASLYWRWMTDICKSAYDRTVEGGAMFFMHREKNIAHVMAALTKAGWTVKNIIIWKKMSSPPPSKTNFKLAYQIIAYAVKGKKANTFNLLRIDEIAPANYKVARPKGVELTNVWTDIRELTSGYLAYPESIMINSKNEFVWNYSKNEVKGKLTRFHKQQSPIALLARIILASTKPNDLFVDLFAGTGTGAIVANQLGRRSISIEIDPLNIQCIEQRVKIMRKPDLVKALRQYYRYTKNIETIWTGTMDKLIVPVTPEKNSKITAGLYQFL
jgi:DNA modification methylase